MQVTTINTANTRYLRRRRFSRTRRAKKLLNWYAARADALKTTGATQAFTTDHDGTLAAATLTLTGQPLDGETLTIGSKIYTFQDTLVNADGNIHIQASVATDITAIVAAIMGIDRVVQAANTLTFSSAPAGADTVTIGEATYIFDASTLTDEPNHVLIGTVEETRDNLLAAITGGAGEGVGYGTGTVANPAVTATAVSTNAILVTAVPLGDLGNVVVATESAANAAWTDTGGTLVGGITRYAAAMTEHPDVTAVDGAGDTVVVTAKVASRASNAIVVATDIVAGSWDEATLVGGEDANILSIATHGRAHLEGPMKVASTTTLPAGLSATGRYWVIRLDANVLKLAANTVNASADVSVPLTGNGTGTHTLSRASEITRDIFEWNKAAKPATLQALTDIDAL